LTRAFWLLLLAPKLSAQQHEMAMMDSAPRWRAMVHGTVFLQYVRAFGTRGAYQLGSVNRVMTTVGGPFGGGTLQLRTMASAEPVTLTDRGMPQPLQVAFTSEGKTITDRAHPSPWIMELAASYERPLAGNVSAAIYAAAIGEPALGPPVYLHRASAEANPAVPLGHHAEDVTHSSFGVVTAGIDARAVRLEFSLFNDREPADIGTVFYYKGARLDAQAGRLSFNVRRWTFAGSYGYLPATASGGAAHSHGSMHRLSVSGVREAAPWFLTLAYAANNPIGNEPAAPAVLVEAEYRSRDGHVSYARAEYVQRTAEELSLVGSVGARQDIASLQLGYARPLLNGRTARVRLGAYTTLTYVPAQLELFYGSSIPPTVAVFAQVTR
jgi:hypothetical protein